MFRVSFCQVPSIQALEDGSIKVYCPGLLVLNTSIQAVHRHLLLSIQYHCQTAVNPRRGGRGGFPVALILAAGGVVS